MLEDKGFTIIDAIGVVPIQSVEIVGDAVTGLRVGRPLLPPANVYLGRQAESFGCTNICDTDETIAPFTFDYAAGSGDYAGENIGALVGKPYPLWNWACRQKLAITKI